MQLLRGQGEIRQHRDHRAVGQRLACHVPGQHREAQPARQAASTAERLLERSGPFTGTELARRLRRGEAQRSSPCTLL